MIERPLSKCVTTFWPLGGVSYPYVVNEREALLYVVLDLMFLPLMEVVQLKN